MGKITNFFIATRGNDYRPPVLSYKALLIYALLLLLVRLFLATPPAGASAVESASLLRLINSERASRNLPTLLNHGSLTRAAQSKSEDMLARGYFAHVDPDGNYVWGRIINAGYTPYKILGENLAIDFSTSEGMVKAWIDSPTHRANLLNPAFVDQGLVALYGNFQERYTNVTTSLFGTLFSVASAGVVSPAPPPAPVSQDATLTAPLSPDKYTFSDIARTTAPFWPRLIFTLFGIIMLAILSIDAIIIYRAKIVTGRSHSSYHLLNFFLFVIISILIWWW